MKKTQFSYIKIFVLLVGAAFLLASRAGHAQSTESGSRIIYNFNSDWKFLKANPDGAELRGYDDSSWGTVSCPHTFNDVDTFDDLSEGRHNGEANQWRGTVWYRKHFRLPGSEAGKKVFIEFESVRQIADVYINGVYLGQNQTGFIPFGYDLTPHLQFGDVDNVIAVRVNNDRGDHFRKNFPLEWNHEHWHPTHGGIYRNVYLHTMDPLHITLPLYDNLETVGTYLYTENVTESKADVTLQAEVMNGRSSPQQVELVARIFDKEGSVVETMRDAAELPQGAVHTFSASGSVVDPKRWSTRYPYLYTVQTTLEVDGKVVDACETPLGIRSFEFNKDTGFWINGESIKLHGWGQKPTAGWPGLGAALPDWLRDFTFRLMDEAGGNFIRWGHCAGSPAEADMADKYGFVTLMPGIAGEAEGVGEAWDIRVAGFRDMIVYYRNHPSIFIWEGGNWAESASNYQDILDIIETYDPQGNRLMGNMRADVKLESEEYVSIEIGTEGWEREYPHLPLIESEYCRDEGPRRVWDLYSPDNDFFNNPRLDQNVYKFASEQFAVRQADHWWNKMGKKPYHSGGANWIFSDGTHGGRNPTEVTRASGEVDAVRLPKEAFYALKSMWRPEPQVHIIGHWNYPEGTVKDMHVISNCAAVKLYVNGELLGTNQSPENGYHFKFPDVAWESGQIKVEAYIEGQLRATQTKETAGEPAALRLTPITGPNGWLADGSDVVLIDFEVVDVLGRRCPLDQSKVNFSVSGPGIWRGGYNSGKPNSTNNLFLETECGINRVAIRSMRQAGTVRVAASREGLDEVTLYITSNPVDISNGLTRQMPQVYPYLLGDSEPLPAYQAPLPPLPPNTRLSSPLFTQFSYTGDHEAILRTNAYWGKKAYTDQEVNYTRIPGYLRGAEYIRMPNADRNYWARDLLQFIAGKDMTIWVGHDDLVSRPEFIGEYVDTGDDIQLGQTTLSLFERNAKAGESIIMAGNSDDAVPEEACMYVVLGKADD
jgi:beta-galactosidase